jgi:ubiquinone/menaquinone biosynthesis C-methylase UbiE
MLPRTLEPEVMDTAAEARDYDAMDHAQVNRVFVQDFLTAWTEIRNPKSEIRNQVSDFGFRISDFHPVLDVGTGTAQIPIELARSHPTVAIVAIDLAEHMLRLGRENVRRAGLAERIRLEKVDAKRLPYPDRSFAAVISNSIVHHIPEPARALAEMVRVTATGGVLFVRDLLRPLDEATVTHLVRTYAGDANAHQQQMFGDSLRAALTLDEVRGLVAALGFEPAAVQQTTDRHWTWRGYKD